MPSKTDKNRRNLKESYSVKSPQNARRASDVYIRLSDVGIIERTGAQEEIAIQIDRILYILENTIQKCKLAISLRQLLENDSFILRYFLKSPDVKFIQNTCSNYLIPQRSLHSESSQSSSNFLEEADCDYKPKVTYNPNYNIQSVEDMVDPQIIQINEILWGNRRLRNKILTDLKDTDDRSCFCFTFINALKSLRDVVRTRLASSAAEELSRERRLRRAWITNSTLTKRISQITEEIKEQRHIMGRDERAKHHIIAGYHRKIKDYVTTLKINIHKRVIESEKKMYKERSLSTPIQARLVEEEKITTLQYEALVVEHLKNEKASRKKRTKVEAQLNSWLTKFDTDVGNRQARIDELTKGYEDEKVEYEKLRISFAQQEKEYTILMAEKYAEDYRQILEKARQFTRNRSAKLIQRYWRAYWQRKLMRKKKKGRGRGKKGKKGKDKGDQLPVFQAPDPNAFFDKKLQGGILDEIQGDDFSREPVVVVL